MAENLFDFRHMTPDELSYISTSLAVALSKVMDDDSAYVLSGVFSTMSGVLAIIVRQHTLLKDAYSPQAGQNSSGQVSSEQVFAEKSKKPIANEKYPDHS